MDIESGVSEPAHRHPAVLTARFATLGLTWAAAIATLVMLACVCWVAFYDTPYADHWLLVPELGGLDNLLTAHNEHPILVGRILFWLDWEVFEGRGRFLQAASVVFIAAQIPLFVWLAREAGLARPLQTMTPVAVALILSVREYENLTWAFQASFVPAFTLALGSFCAFAAYVRRGSPIMLACACAGAALAAASLASGVFAPAILAASAVVLGRRMAAAIFAAITVAVAVLLIPGIRDSGYGYTTSIPTMIQFFFVFLGAPAAKWGFPAALGAGVLVAGAGAAALAYIIRYRRSEPPFVALAGVLLFGFLTAAAMTAGRSFVADAFGVLTVATVSRYHIVLGLLYVAILIVAIAAAPRGARPIALALTFVSPLAAALLGWFAVGGFAIIKEMNDRHRADLAGTTALIAGVADKAAIDRLTGFYGAVGQADILEPGAIRIRSERKSIFADPVASRVGSTLAPEEQAARPCDATGWEAAPADSAAPFLRAQGQFARNKTSAGASHILITDASGAVVGYGRVPRRPSDLNPFSGNDGRPLDWQGHIQGGAQAPFDAWLSGPRAIRCALGVAGAKG